MFKCICCFVIGYCDVWPGGGGSTLVGCGRTIPLRVHTRWRRAPMGRPDRGASGAVVRSHGRHSRLQDLTVRLCTLSEKSTVFFRMCV